MCQLPTLWKQKSFYVFISFPKEESASFWIVTWALQATLSTSMSQGIDSIIYIFFKIKKRVIQINHSIRWLTPTALWNSSYNVLGCHYISIHFGNMTLNSVPVGNTLRRKGLKARRAFSSSSSSFWTKFRNLGRVFAKSLVPYQYCNI